MARNGQPCYESRRAVGELFRSLKEVVERGRRDYGEYMLEKRKYYTLNRKILQMVREDEFMENVLPVYL